MVLITEDGPKRFLSSLNSCRLTTIKGQTCDIVVIPTTVITTPFDRTRKINNEYQAKFKNGSRTMRGHLLNHMKNLLFDMFFNYNSVKAI